MYKHQRKHTKRQILPKQRKKQEMYQPTSEICLISIKEALELIQTYNQSNASYKVLVEEGCQLASDKQVVEDNHNTSLCVEHNSLSFMKEIITNSLLKADFFTSVKVLCFMLKTENVCMAFDSVYFKKAAIMIYMYHENISQLDEFLTLMQKSNIQQEALSKKIKRFLKLKPYESIGK